MEMADRFYERCAMCGWGKVTSAPPPDGPHTVTICEMCLVGRGPASVTAAMEREMVAMGIAHDVTKPISLHVMSRRAA